MIIREVTENDVAEVIELIKGLAKFENDLEAVKNTPEKLKDDLFVNKYCEALVAEEENTIIGFALFYTSYSTWKGPCIYLEDLYIIPEKRSYGAGSLLFDKIVQIAKDRHVARMDWQVLDWNQSAIDFYKRKGATIDTDWLNGRMFFPENE
jgi:GNAT superfamily N-acetyltransferase